MRVSNVILISSLIACASMLAMSLPAAATPGTVRADDMPLGAPTMAPYGFLKFCTHNPSACGLDTATDAADQSEHALMQNQWELVFAAATPAPNTSLRDTQPPERPTEPASPTVISPTTQFPDPLSDEAPPPPDAEFNFDSSRYRPSPSLEAPLIHSLSAIDLSLAKAPSVDWPNPPLPAAEPQDALDARPDGDGDGDGAFEQGGTTTTSMTWVEPTNSVASNGASGAISLTNFDLTFPKRMVLSFLALEGSQNNDRSTALDAVALQPSNSTKATQDGGAAATSDDDRMILLAQINARINAAIVPALDMQAFGVNDVWTLPLEHGGVPMGNCKHYALEKREALVRAGIPPADMSIAIVRTGYGEMHAVLLVRTETGEVVLDNLTGQIKSWREVSYTWLERQKPGQPLVWVSLNQPQRGGGNGV